jgi:hypothetical protein
MGYNEILNLSGGRDLDWGKRMDHHSLEDEREPTSLLGKTADLFLRGQYASAAFFETILSQPGLALGSAVVNAGKELFNPSARLSFKDLIKNHAPQFAQDNPAMTSFMGFVGDIAFDPLTWTTFGTSAGRQIILKGGRKVLSKKATKAFVQEGAAKLGAPRLTPKGKEMLQKMYKQHRRGGHNAADAYALSISTLKNKVNQLVKPGHTPQQIWQTTDALHMDEQFGALISQTLGSKEMTAAFLKKHGLKESEVFASTGVRFMGKKVPGTTRPMEVVNGMVGDLFRPLKETKFASMVSKAFNKNVGIPPEVRRMIADRHAAVSEAERGVRSFLMHAIDNPNMKEDSFEAIGSWALYFQELGTKLYHGAGITAGSPGKDKSQAASLAWERVYGLINGNVPFERLATGKLGKRVQKLMTKHNDDLVGTALRPLAPEERHVLMGMMQNMKDLSKLEIESQLIKRTKGVYWPGYYKNIGDAIGFTAMRRATKGLPGGKVMDAAHVKKLKTVSAAYAAGFEPIMDAGAIYTARVMQSQRQLADVNLSERIVAMFPEILGKLGKKERKKILDSLAVHNPKVAAQLGKGSKKAVNKMLARNPDLKRLAEATDLDQVLAHVQKLGEGFYSKLASEEVTYFARGYDKLMSLFRTSATVARPAFGVRNAVSNGFQIMIKSGIKGLGGPGKFGFDPTSAFDAMLTLKGKTNFHITTPTGIKYTGEELAGLTQRYNIIRNQVVDGDIGRGAIAGIESAQKFTKQIMRDKRAREVFEKGGAAGEGLHKIFSGAMNYMNFPAVVEDTARTTMFYNLLRNGHDAQTAANLVDKALFDYTHGLSQFESQWMRRIIPFYSFQRFATELLGEAAFKTPGRIANATKVGKQLATTFNSIDNAMAGREHSPLTEAERRVLPGWLIEQPHKFAGWSKEMRAVFHTFNNFSPLDVMGFLTSKDGNPGEIDVRRTMKQAFLAQLTPAIKVPTELMLGEDFFTGRSFENARKVGHMDQDHFLSAMVAAVVGSTSIARGGANPLLKALGAGAAVELMTSLAPEQAKATMARWLQMEDGIDSEGKPTTYFSPYAFHIVGSFFPAVNDMTKMARYDKTPLEKTMQFLGGIPTISLDLEQERLKKIRQSKYMYQGHRFQVQKAVREQRHEAATRAHTELMQFVLELQDDWRYVNQPVRGAEDATLDESVL